MGNTEDLLVNFANLNSPSVIKVVGVGGGGGNAVGQMFRDAIPEVRYLVANTDAKALQDSPVPDRLQMGAGLGAGGRPELGRKYAEESVEKIKKELDDGTKMLFITAGMGGGTGTGASPVIARVAREKGLLTVGVVTIPFLFEMKPQIDKALDGLDLLAKEVDALLVINNQRLIDIYPDFSIVNAFKKADQTLSTAVRSITEIISMHGRVNLDFNDVNMVLRDGGVSIMSTGYGEGDGRVTKAIEEALHSPLLNSNDVYQSSRLLLCLTFNPDEDALAMGEMALIESFMEKFASQNIQFKYGLATDGTLGKKVKVTLLASGFGLYGNKSRAVADADGLSDAERLRRDIRRGRFYGGGGNSSQVSGVYLFTPEDLLNAELIEEVESVPTGKRSPEQLRRIKSAARGGRPEPADTAAQAGDVISFG